MMWVYVQSEPTLWTTGFYDPDGRWQPDEDFGDKEAAARRVAWLNGERGVAAEPNAEYEALRAAERGFIVAPWTDRQVEALNTWQRERPVHPFTCGKRDDHESEGVLTATREGWVCEEPDCDYAQDWAHDFMAMTAGVAAEPNEGHGDGA